MSKRTTELKSLQHRAEVSKTEADQAKTQAKALKAALDKVTSRGGAGGAEQRPQGSGENQDWAREA